jgi:hypothetical protein
MVRRLWRSRRSIDETGHIGALGDIGFAGSTGEKVCVAGRKANRDLDDLSQAQAVRKLVFDSTTGFIIQHRHHRAPNQGRSGRLPLLSLCMQPGPQTSQIHGDPVPLVGGAPCRS